MFTPKSIPEETGVFVYQNYLFPPTHTPLRHQKFDLFLKILFTQNCNYFPLEVIYFRQFSENIQNLWEEKLFLKRGGG